MVEIPFNKWSREKLANRKKIATSRNKTYGYKGDEFKVNLGDSVRTYRIVYVETVSLGFVANYCYKLEGADSPEEFIDVWNKIHWKRKYDPEHRIRLHCFEEINKEQINKNLNLREK